MTDPREFINPVDVTWTPDDGSPVVLGHVKRVTYDQRDEVVEFAGDTDVCVSAVKVVKSRPYAIVETLGPGAMDGVPSGTRGTLAWTAADSFNGTLSGGGAMRYTLTGAVFARRPVDLPYYVPSSTAFCFHAASVVSAAAV